MTLKDIVQLVIKADAKDADEEIKSLNKIIKDMTDSVGRSSIKIEKLEENTAKLKDKVSVLNDELEQETKELSRLAIESQQAADITKKLSIETQQASEEYTKIKREVAAYEKQQGTANRKIDEAKFNLDRLAQANITSGKEWDKYTKQVEQAETKLEFVGIQLDKLNPELEKQAQVVKKCENAQKTANLTSEAAAKAYADQEKVIKNINTETEKYNRSIDANNLALEKAIDSQRKNIDVINQSIQATKQAEASTNIFGKTLKVVEAAQKGVNSSIKMGTDVLKFFDDITGNAVTSSKAYEAAMKGVESVQKQANAVIDKGVTVLKKSALATDALGKATKLTAGFLDKFTGKSKKAEQATTELGHDVIRTKEDFDRYAKSVQKATTELNQNSTAAKKNAKATKGGAKSAKSMAGAFIGIATALVGATAQYGKFIQGVENGAMQFEAAFVGMEEETSKMQSTLEEYFGVTEVGFQKVSAQLKIQAENLGMNTEEAQNFSLAAIGMVGALSATNTAGLSFAQTAERMASALRGEAEAAEMLGLSLGAVPMQEFISSQERFGIATDTSWASLSAEEQMALRLAAAIEQTAVSMGLTIEPITNMDTAMAGLTTVMQTASESVSVYQQATNGLKTAFEDFLLALKPVMFLLTLLATVILDALAIAFTVIGALVAAIIVPFQAAYDAVIEFTGGSEDLSAALDVLAGWLEIIAKAALITAAVFGVILGGAFAIVTQLAADFVLGVQDMLIDLTNDFTAFGDDIKIGLDAFKESFRTAYTETSGLSAVFTGVLRLIFNNFMLDLKTELTNMFDDWLLIFGEGFEFIAADTGSALGGILGVFNQFFIDTSQGWMSLFENVLGLLSNFGSLAFGSITNSTIAITGVVSGFVDGLLSTIQPLIDRITELVNSFIEIANTVIEIVTPPLEWFIDNILVPIQPIIAAVANLVGTVLGNAFGALLSILDPVLAVFQHIFDIIQGILDPIQRCVDAIFRLIEPLDILYNIAQPIADIINGITESIGWLTDAISDFMNKVGDDIADGGILDVFGSHSASAETASINASVNRAISATMAGFSTAPSGGIVNNSDTTVQVNVQGASKSLTTINREARIMTQTRGVTW